MSNKIAVGSKIYDISNFAEHEQQDISKLSKALNYRVNQVISAFGIYDQEMALIMSALSLLEENESLKVELNNQTDLFPPEKPSGEYSKEEVEEAILSVVSSLKAKLEKFMNQK